MFRHKPYQRTWLSLGFETLELIYHVAVRNLRKTHNNAVLGLLMSILQSLMLLVIMYFMMSLFGMRRNCGEERPGEKREPEAERGQRYGGEA